MLATDLFSKLNHKPFPCQYSNRKEYLIPRKQMPSKIVVVLQRSYCNYIIHSYTSHPSWFKFKSDEYVLRTCAICVQLKIEEFMCFMTQFVWLVLIISDNALSFIRCVCLWTFLQICGRYAYIRMSMKKDVICKYGAFIISIPFSLLYVPPHSFASKILGFMHSHMLCKSM